MNVAASMDVGPFPLTPSYESRNVSAFLYEPDLFHVLDGDVLMCAHHGAMYRIADGFCFDGPCEGASLMPIPVAIKGDTVVMA